MGETRTYYRPRILLPVESVQDCDFPETLICLTGPEQAMLRTVVDYLNRRSTWVAAYHETSYEIPDDETWDVLQALTADLEEKLMGCTELTALLESIAACACQTASQTQLEYGSPVTGGMYDRYVEDTTLQDEDPYQVETEAVDAARCAIAVLTYEMAYEILDEVIQPAQRATQDALLPAVLAFIIAALGTPAALLPAGAVYLAINALIDAWVEGQLANVLNELAANREELICAVYETLDGGTFRDAEQAAWVVIDDMSGITIIDKLVFKALFAPWAMHAVRVAYDASTPWAVARLDPDACAACSIITPTFSLEYDFPPCPNGWWWNYVCWDGKLCGNSNNQPFFNPAWYVTGSGLRDVVFEADFISNFGSGWGVGEIHLTYSPTGADPWTSITHGGLQTSVPSGQVNYRVQEREDKQINEGWYRLQYNAGFQQYDEEPYPFSAQRIKVWTKLPD